MWMSADQDRSSSVPALFGRALEKRTGEKVDDPLQMYLGDIYTLSLNLAGNCGISIPCGFTGGLPLGVQILGDAYDESTVLRVAYAYEQATDWHLRSPSL